MTTKLHPGMGDAVARRTVLRKRTLDGSRELNKAEMSRLFLQTADTPENERVQFTWETWQDVAHRVAAGNTNLCPDPEDRQSEYEVLYDHIERATTLMSGRHLQHGDPMQQHRNKEVFTNCATSATTFLLFYLLLNGAGVGRSYDDDLMVVNWDYAPEVRCVLDENHPDFDASAHESLRDAKHKYRSRAIWFEVQDSREGWAKALELWERLTSEKVYKDRILVLDFSPVRAKNTPIGGMQNRPASGPVSVMNAFNKSSSVCRSGMPKWKQTMYIDHYFAECVLVGGARRAARMATKWWKDKTILDFIDVKRPTEYDGFSSLEVYLLRSDRTARSLQPYNSFLWSSNNSVLVDDEFWRYLSLSKDEISSLDHDEQHWADWARIVFDQLTERSYGDGTGEPGILNAHKMVQNDDGLESLVDGKYVGSERYKPDLDTERLLSRIAHVVATKKYYHITNPCGEITLALYGGFCVIADVVPFRCETLEDVYEAFRVTTRALIRVNLMDSIYHKESLRTNRIGVGITGIHEFAWKFFRCSFRDLINPDFEALPRSSVESAGIDHANPRIRSAAFWYTLAKFSNVVREEAAEYSSYLELPTPHTSLTIKPAGTTSKLFGLTEGWHLPSMRQYLRWVQFRSDDPLVDEYRKNGYPTRSLTKYEGTTIVGFPTSLAITEIDMPEDKIVTASQATPEEQFEWLRLGEKFWLSGFDSSCDDNDKGNQISYTLKYDPRKITLAEFRSMILDNIPTIRACSVMPQDESVSYEYQPEQPITKVEFEAIVRKINRDSLVEDVDEIHVDKCAATGACPTGFSKDDNPIA